jgi:hypothetical protein
MKNIEKIKSSAIRHSTANPVELSVDIVAKVAKNHCQIIGKIPNDSARCCAVTRTACIPLWAK